LRWHCWLQNKCASWLCASRCGALQELQNKQSVFLHRIEL
jgi:hypothetical protein